MSFVLRSLSVLAYANGFTLWHYKGGEDALSAIGRSGYFNEAGDMLAGGDVMLVSTREGGGVLCVAAGAGTITAEPLA